MITITIEPYDLPLEIAICQSINLAIKQLVSIVPQRDYEIAICQSINLAIDEGIKQGLIEKSQVKVVRK